MTVTPIPYGKAKAAYRAATERMSAAAQADGLSQAEYGRLCPEPPVRTIEYEHPGFTNGVVTLAPHKTTQDLTGYHVKNPTTVDAFRDHAGYLAFCEDYRQWQELSDAVSDQLGLDETCRASMISLSEQSAAWATMSLSVASNLEELVDKIETCRGDSMVTDEPDGTSVIDLLDAIARDLRRLTA